VVWDCGRMICTYHKKNRKQPKIGVQVGSFRDFCFSVEVPVVSTRHKNEENCKIVCAFR